MDFIAHGLWGGAFFGGKRKSSFIWAFRWGVEPDLIAFGPAILASIVTGHYFDWASYPPDGIPRSWISAWSYHAYHVTHSLVIWSSIAAGFWLWKKRFPWVFAASALHILCDIPLHALNYFPTPYLWPLPTPLHDGTRWANSRFMLANYALLAATYLFLLYRYRRELWGQTPQSPNSEKRN